MTTDHRAFGMRLVKMQLGHWFVLESIESPLVTQAEMTLDDAMVVAFVCADPHGEAARNIKSRWLGFFTRLLAWRLRKTNPKDEIAKLNAYLEEMNTSPEVSSNGSPSVSNGPWHWTMLAFLMGIMHMTHQAALDLPVATAFGLWGVESERTGSGRITDGYRLRSFRQRVKEMESATRDN